jgi:hypothetical protein
MPRGVGNGGTVEENYPRWKIKTASELHWLF